MRLQTVPAARGTLWVKQGFQAFFKRPLAFAALFATFMFAVFLLALVPFVGALLLLALLPLVSLGFMIATRVTLDGGAPGARAFIEPLRRSKPQRNAILQLGIVYAVATFAVMALSDFVDGGAFEALMDAMPAGQSAPDAVTTKLAAPGLGLGMLLRFGLAALLSVPFWHAPALVHWDNHGCAKALFSSTLACWRNRGAFAVYSLMWFGLIVAFGMIGSLVFSLLGQAQLFALAAVPLSLGFTTVFYVSLYFTFADCFVATDGDAIASHPPEETS
ncbi:MAG: BPSS1780 family membrane protein [Pseudomonadota bacterium]